MADAAGTVVRDNPPISRIRVLRRAPARTKWTDDSTREEPVSPSSRLMGDIYIIVMVGFGVSINLPMFRAGLEAQLAQYARLTSVQVTEDGKPRWVRTTVNIDDHLMLPRLDPTAMTTQPDQVVDDYVAALTTVPMNRSRPLWECHFLDFPTSEATSTLVMRAEHSIGDGMSALSFLLASTRSGSAHMTTSLPSRRLGATYALPWSRPQHSVGAASFVASVWSSFVLAWHTLVDTALFLATVLFLRDPHTLLKGQAKDSSSKFHGKRFAQRTLSLDDIKFIKDALNCTVNDVLLGLTSAALSRYYFRHSGDRSTRKICLRSILVVNIRPDTGLQVRYFSTPKLHA
uniref:Uncharacterized protein n=1 Tax=Avena sativa TaxID=4498 RepID=A0ACD6ANH1_AVESA